MKPTAYKILRNVTTLGSRMVIAIIPVWEPAANHSVDFGSQRNFWCMSVAGNAANFCTALLQVLVGTSTCSYVMQLCIVLTLKLGLLIILRCTPLLVQLFCLVCRACQAWHLFHALRHYVSGLSMHSSVHDEVC